MVKSSRYYVHTWDGEKQKFTPQVGVRCGPYSLWGLRKAIRKLRDMGYSCHRTTYLGKHGRVCGDSDPAVLIERDEE